MDAEGTYNTLEAFTEKYFIIKNDVGNHFEILETDDDITRAKKTELKRQHYAIYDESTRHWTMQLPHWFTESEYEFKNITIESFTYFKPDGTLDLGTSFHCKNLTDGDFSQFDHMICLANDGVERTFYIDSKEQNLEFWFKDYLNEDENLTDKEEYHIHVKDEEGTLLYWEPVAYGLNFS